MNYKYIARQLENEYLNNGCQETALDTILNEYGLVELGFGTYRTVFVNDDDTIVYKIGNPRSNKSEWDYYKEATNRLRSVLAKPLYLSLSQFVLVMQCVPRPVSKIEAMVFRAKYSHLIDIDNSDLCHFNMGKTKSGKILLIDYESWEVNNVEYN